MSDIDSMITLDETSIHGLDEAQIKRLKKLTLGRRGQMLCQLNCELRANDDSNATAVIARDSSGFIYGWALVFESDRSFKDAYFFVDPEFRRCGLAQQLVEYVIDKYPMPRFHPHDIKAAAFFLRFEGKFRVEAGVGERLSHARNLQMMAM